MRSNFNISDNFFVQRIGNYQDFDHLQYNSNLFIERYNRDGNFINISTYHNAAGSSFVFGVFYSLVYQQPIPKINAIAFGSKSGNIFVAASFCGTTSFGTQGNLLQQYNWGSYFALFRGTITFNATMLVTDAQMGSAYLGINNFNMFHYVYAYKTGLNTYYYPGDIAVVTWYLNMSFS